MKDIHIRKTVNKSLFKIPVERDKIELLKKSIITLIKNIEIDPKESEENFKKYISDFLRDVWYGNNYLINTKKRMDFVIRNGNDANSSVGVIFETKHPDNKRDMISRDNINCKAMQQLLFYYLNETIGNEKSKVKHLIITNVYEWFIFNAEDFYTLFSQDKELIKEYKSYENKEYLDSSTDYFYTNIASAYIKKNETKITYVYLDIRGYKEKTKENNEENDKLFFDLYKLLSPEHLLKLPFVNDSNLLDNGFYNELLYIMGLLETKEEGKKVIKREKKDKRNEGSLIENTISCLENDYINVNNEDKLFETALELVITWIDRILFLKLLESQQYIYQKKNKDYLFLNIERINSYSELNTLFFKILAQEINDRTENHRKKYLNIPYLNSSLFEMTDTEKKYFSISKLEELDIYIFSSTVLKNNEGKKRTGRINTLNYLFDFLDSYDFSSEGREEIQDVKKTLINASVLGLIFEKINGYKNGSFFTPGFITNYICKDTIRNVVINKFNEIKNWNATNLDELYNKIDDIIEANDIINSIKICDPAVGSGHFLVSALNEIIAIKSNLGILADKNNRKLKYYNIEVSNDELTIYDEENNIYLYNVNDKESRRIQETIFNEKRRIIEGSLFGVDINPKSVMICRLRLWIELLKNTFYTEASNFTELETLPNIDINIKNGNSLISRFEIDINMKTELKKIRHSVSEYQETVRKYQNAKKKDEKMELICLINEIKENFRGEIENNTKLSRKKRDLHIELDNFSQGELFGLTKEEQLISTKRINKITDMIAEIERKIEDIKNDKIYENAFEWRFEFPEMLNNDGEYIGFDVIIGNPPYIKIQNIDEKIAELFKNKYKAATGKFDIYVLFVEKAFELIKQNGIFSFIQPHRFLNADYGNGIRNYLISNKGLNKFINFGVDQIFGSATTYTGIFFYKRNNDLLMYSRVDNIDLEKINFKTKDYKSLKTNWTFEYTDNNILEKIYSMPINVLDIFEGIFQGVITVGDDIFILEGNITNNMFEGYSKELNKNICIESVLMKPLLKGEDIKRYGQPITNKYIFFPHFFDGKKTKPLSEEILKKEYPLAYNYISNFKEYLFKKKINYKTNPKYWYSLHRAREINIFETKKLITPQLQNISSFAYDENYCYPDAGGYCLIPFKKHEKDLFIYYAILNSSLFYYFIKNTSTPFNNEYYYFKTAYIQPFKFPNIDNNNTKEEIIETVKKIINKKRVNILNDTKEEEKVLDNIVYSLYNLTPEEITLISSSN